MSVEKMMHDMIEMLEDAVGDAVKHDKGNKAAGTRVRKAMQSAKGMAQSIRVQVQNDKN
ncbi:histone H1 [Euryarchaeota archaeon]|nr:histone H1 [Euryarchaeota archaeon]|tara:strand:+ start:1069 stop:1245 length:177 start_codon:yes stop_codon:yes gene_type:complete